MKVSVVIPALNEQDTVAGVVEQCLASSADEVLVVDPDSTDATAERAAAAGARVVPWREVDPREPWEGKGEALWRGVKAASGDVVVFVDADVTSLQPWWVDALAAPLQDSTVHLVKASYDRTRAGGRVTELTAKPLLRACFPELAHIRQPLAGEYAIRRSTALRLPFVSGYGVEAGLLIDVASAHTPASIQQAQLSPREHRNRPLTQLAPMADVVARTILARAGVADIEVRERPAWVDG
ncbi:glucosyl-3-phosphoglycerate synthase [Corynebacterium wankanglinii]|uniref:Glucosyl-3-phosphoglycerate synthase n=1 Tax=Corynebacterium wankanglinii TaxID=2735136 RepID=A0A838CKW1_9CORY|nr:glucosyl-3-phosphoglycerate synthase [Corynebacterium wankanglinii]MBA1835492.1 glucosyl-3-phosphoglycerate synthase [Corynebacterium wankanglinii]